MRIISGSMFAGMLLLASGCSAGSDGQPSGVVRSEPLQLVGEVDLPKNATVEDIPVLLKSAGVTWDDFGGEITLEGPFVESAATSGRSLVVVKDPFGSKTRLIARSGGLPRLTTLVVCVRGEGATATASDLNLGDVCK
ncbi:hypothetical protein [Xanthomonas translucens]|uniref:hypothetical protein n=1 Tax=Xanthomonas campestris pv. translucens TaxID=343 RepID=UPI00114CD9F7|nr:hypothetical protein [Xanthomonas translucens]